MQWMYVAGDGVLVKTETGSPALNGLSLVAIGVVPICGCCCLAACFFIGYRSRRRIRRVIRRLIDADNGREDSPLPHPNRESVRELKFQQQVGDSSPEDGGKVVLNVLAAKNAMTSSVSWSSAPIGPQSSFRSSAGSFGASFGPVKATTARERLKSASQDSQLGASYDSTSIDAMSRERVERNALIARQLSTPQGSPFRGLATAKHSFDPSLAQKSMIRGGKRSSWSGPSHASSVTSNHLGSSRQSITSEIQDQIDKMSLPAIPSDLIEKTAADIIVEGNFCFRPTLLDSGLNGGAGDNHRARQGSVSGANYSRSLPASNPVIAVRKSAEYRTSTPDAVNQSPSRWDYRAWGRNSIEPSPTG